GFADRAVQQRIEVLAIRALETRALLDVGMDHAARLAGEEPLVQPLHGELARPATGAARPAARARRRPLPSGRAPLLRLIALARHLADQPCGSSASDSI